MDDEFDGTMEAHDELVPRPAAAQAEAAQAEAAQAESEPEPSG